MIQKNYFQGVREIPNSNYKPARTILKGALKLYSFGTFSFDEGNARDFYVWDKKSDIVSFPYEDYFSFPIWHMILESVLIILWVTAFIMCMAMLLIKLVQKLRKSVGRPLGTWAVTAMLWQLFIIVLFAFIAYNAKVSSTAYTYLWAFKAIFVLLLAMIVWAVAGFAGLIKSDMRKGTRAFRILTLGTLIISIINVWYWNMFMFWVV